jgi:hypothetical protein
VNNEVHGLVLEKSRWDRVFEITCRHIETITAYKVYCDFEQLTDKKGWKRCVIKRGR